MIESDAAIAHLSPDEKRIETLDLQDHARITASNAGVGGLQSLSGRDMNLKYAADGESLEHAVITGDAVDPTRGRDGETGAPDRGAHDRDRARA